MVQSFKGFKTKKIQHKKIMKGKMLLFFPTKDKDIYTNIICAIA